MSETQGHVLIDIIENSNGQIKYMAEVGVYKSHTTKRVLRKCKGLVSQYWAIDIWQNSNHWLYRDRAIEFWDSLYFKACKLMYWFPQLRVLRLPSVEASKIFPQSYFDLVFIDADHSYKSVTADIKAWLPLVRKGGLITGHDYGANKIEVKKAVDEIFGENGVKTGLSTVWIKKVQGAITNWDV